MYKCSVIGTDVRPALEAFDVGMYVNTAAVLCSFGDGQQRCW